ncbi:hypothetical protein N9993_01465 [bacterium]|nr:hypothetical protein [bacterium]
MTYVVSTQCLENYGAHCEDGKFSSGNAYWKMKGGADYIVDGLERIQDAVAFVAALCTQNNISFKEFPVKFRTIEEWEDELAELSTDYQDFLLASAKRVSPQEVI